MISKFQKELQTLVNDKIITQDIAEHIDKYYASKEDNKSGRLFTIFGVLGSLLIGMGIILIVAHNWDHFSRSIKTLFAFLPLLIGQSLVGYSVFKAKGKTWREASGTFLFFAVGACIALISQIYNIPGDLSSYLLTWTLLCIPIIYLLRSQAVAILCLVFATYYACNCGYAFTTRGQTPWYYLLLFVLVLPHYIQLLKSKPQSNITSVFNWLFPLSLIIVLGAFTDRYGDLGYLMYILLFGLFYNIGKLPFFDSQLLRKNGYVIFGSLGTVFLLLITSFKWIWRELFVMQIGFATQEMYIASILFLLAFSLLLYSYSRKWVRQFNLYRFVFIIFTLYYIIGFKNATIPTVLVNVLILALGIMAIKIGADKMHFGTLNYGLLIVAVLITCRFFDTNMSFVLRGSLFVTVGAGFFIANYLMFQKQKKKT
ncbi:DUF2157 domain-containing protein [Winogradskyella sp.]|uniref:DUF2157 domain-containing protein n=1 Tax=Winogradskyella sp. TaxID=1883156 RepID=UPI00261A1D78|nr:DUF2157 domain-containing protein [Winogradskyella sp.]